MANQNENIGSARRRCNYGRWTTLRRRNSASRKQLPCPVPRVHTNEVAVKNDENSHGNPPVPSVSPSPSPSRVQVCVNFARSNAYITFMSYLEMFPVKVAVIVCFAANNTRFACNVDAIQLYFQPVRACIAFLSSGKLESFH